MFVCPPREFKFDRISTFARVLPLTNYYYITIISKKEEAKGSDAFNKKRGPCQIQLFKEEERKTHPVDGSRRLQRLQRL